MFGQEIPNNPPGRTQQGFTNQTSPPNFITKESSREAKLHSKRRETEGSAPPLPPQSGPTLRLSEEISSDLGLWPRAKAITQRCINHPDLILGRLGTSREAHLCLEWSTRIDPRGDSGQWSLFLSAGESRPRVAFPFSFHCRRNTRAPRARNLEGSPTTTQSRCPIRFDPGLNSRSK